MCYVCNRKKIEANKIYSVLSAVSSPPPPQSSIAGISHYFSKYSSKNIFNVQFNPQFSVCEL